MTTFPFGSHQHVTDIARLLDRGAALPHGYRPDEGDPEAWWCRVSRGTELLSGVVVTRSHSRAVPGTLILRIERFGRALHAPVVRHIDVFGAHLRRLSRRTLVIQMALFDEDLARREVARNSLERLGYRRTRLRSYTTTLRLALHPDEQLTLGAFSQSARRGLRAFAQAGGSVHRVTDARMLPWIERLHAETFARTGGTAPRLPFGDALGTPAADTRSALFAAFASAEPAEEALVAFGLVLGHGDHGTYEAGGSRSPRGAYHTFAGVGGYPVMWECIRWATASGCTWFDMGGSIDPSAPGTEALRGIEEFKRRFSKEQIDVGEELALEPNPALMALARTSRAVVQRLNRWRRRGS